jgi:hypothetical protein
VCVRVCLCVCLSVCLSAFVSLLSKEDEGYELKEQLLILRNAILTGYEQYVATTDKETRDKSDEKCMFVMKMEVRRVPDPTPET